MHSYRTDEQELKRLRRSRGMTQIDLARACGFDNTWLSRVESGDRSLTQDQLRQVADLFGVDMRTLQTEAPKRERLHRHTSRRRPAGAA